MYEFRGKIEVLKDTEKINESFSKREFVVNDEDDRYPQVVQFELMQDKVGLLDKFKIGDRVNVAFNIRGREWTSPQGDVRYFVSLNDWKIDSLETANAPGQPVDSAPFPDSEPFGMDEEGIDDIPF